MISAALALIVIFADGSGLSQEELVPAHQLFGQIAVPAAMPARSIGFYSEGCLAGAVELPIDGSNWQAMRLQRNRNWGHPTLVDYIRQLAEDAARIDSWPGLLVGDMSQPRGGPMAGGHVSHQTGLDVDVWYAPMPEERLTEAERAELSAVTLVGSGSLEIDLANWDDGIARLLYRAASYPEVERIFVHPAIKARLCETAGADREWLRVIRPWYGHADHFHVRLQCPPGEELCASQAPPPDGDGCGAELEWWLGPEPWLPTEEPSEPRPPKTLADLPPACAAVLMASTTGPPMPLPRPEK